MADKITDDELRKEIIALSGENIGPITGSTRGIYIKKLNHLRAKQNSAQKKPGRRKSGARNLVGFSSEESDGETETLDVKTRASSSRGRKRASTSRSVPRREETPPPPKPPPRQTRKSAAAAAPSALQPASRKSFGGTAAPQSQSLVGPHAASTRESFGSTSGSQRRILGRSGLRNANSEPGLALRQRGARRSGHVQPSFIPVQPSFIPDRTYDPNEHDESSEDDDDGANMAPGMDMPDVDYFNSSDSDLEPGEIAEDDLSYDSPMPEMVSRAINTSPGLDSTAMSYGSSFVASPRSSSNSVAQTPNSSINHSPQQDSAYPMRKVPIYRTRRAHHDATGQSFSQYVSTFLLVLAGLFFAVLAFAYLQMANNSDLVEPVTNQLQICSEKQAVGCLPQDKIKVVKQLVRMLSDSLSTRAGSFDCGEGPTSRRMTLDEIRSSLGKDHEDWITTKTNGEKSVLTTVLGLIAKTPHWNMRLLNREGEETDDIKDVVAMESDDPTKSLWCRLQQSLAKVLYLVLLAVALALLVTLGIAYARHRRRKQEEETRDVYELVEKIIDILKTHHEVCKRNKELQPYLAIPHVRDMLIPPADRRKRQNVWDKAVKFLSMNESRVRVESQKISGEEFPVWRWLQTCSNGERVWIGPAFGEYKDTGLNSPPSTPAPCLKIRNMFDLDIEIGEDWHVRVQDAILEKSGPDHGIVHIAVDTSSNEGCVYVKCQDLEAAGRAFKVLHGWWFDGNLVTVKFLRLERYHERFPDAVSSIHPLQPSNNKCLSLSQPFHRSVIETS